MAKAITPEKIKETKKELATARKDAAALKRAVSAMQKAFMTDPNKENGGYYRSAVSDHIKAVNVVEKLSTKLDGMLAAD